MKTWEALLAIAFLGAIIVTVSFLAIVWSTGKVRHWHHSHPISVHWHGKERKGRGR